MAFKVGESYTFKDVQTLYKSMKPGEKGLTQGGFLNPSRGNPSTLIRAIFARREINGPLDNLLFVSGDNEYRNYLKRLEKVQQESSPFHYFKERSGEWFYMGNAKIAGLLVPGDEELTLLLEEMGHTLAKVGEADGRPLWQLSAPGGYGFIRPRKLEFVAVLQQNIHI